MRSSPGSRLFNSKTVSFLWLSKCAVYQTKIIEVPNFVRKVGSKDEDGICFNSPEMKKIISVVAALLRLSHIPGACG